MHMPHPGMGPLVAESRKVTAPWLWARWEGFQGRPGGGEEVAEGAKVPF